MSWIERTVWSWKGHPRFEVKRARFLGGLLLPSGFDIKVETLEDGRVKLDYVERHSAVLNEDDWKIVADQTLSSLRKFSPDWEVLELIPEKREVRGKLIGQARRVFSFLYAEILASYLASGGDVLGAVEAMARLSALQRGVMLVEKPLDKYFNFEQAVLAPETVAKEALSKVRREDLLKLKGLVEQELKRRGG